MQGGVDAGGDAGEGDHRAVVHVAHVVLPADLRMGRARRSSITTKCVVAACPSKRPLWAGRAPSQIEVTTLPRSCRARSQVPMTGFSGSRMFGTTITAAPSGWAASNWANCLLRDDPQAAAGRCRIGGRRDGDDVERARFGEDRPGRGKSAISVPAWLSSSAAVGRAGSKAGAGGTLAVGGIGSMCITRRASDTVTPSQRISARTAAASG